MNDLKKLRLNRKNLKKTLESLNQLIETEHKSGNTNFHNTVIDAFTKVYQERYGILTNRHHKHMHRFTVGRFTCWFKYQELDLDVLGKPKGLYIEYIDNKRKMKNFRTTVDQFIQFYDDNKGYLRMEMIIFPFM